MPRNRRVMTKNQMRGLKQYQDLSDEEFEEVFEDKASGVIFDVEFNKKIDEKLAEFEEDYDLSDLKVNDKATLRSLAQTVIHLENLDQLSYKLFAEGVNDSNILVFEKLNNVMSTLRKDISKMQDDLKITRRVRKGDQEESVLAYINSLRVKARKFYESRADYIFCPKCMMLIGTVWVLYPQAKNIFTLTCQRTLEDGTLCGEVLKISSKDLKSKRGFSTDNIPDGMK